MGYTEKRETAKGTRYLGVYRAPDGRKHSKSFPTRREAARWTREAESKLDRGTWIDPRSHRTTFRDYAALWQAAQVHRPQTTSRIDSNLRVHVLPAFGDRALVSIRSSEIQGVGPWPVDEALALERRGRLPLRRVDLPLRRP